MSGVFQLSGCNMSIKSEICNQKAQQPVAKSQEQTANSYKLSKYAYGTDYHFVIKDKLKQLLNFIQKWNELGTKPNSRRRKKLDLNDILFL